MGNFNQHIENEMKLQEYLGLWFLPVDEEFKRNCRAGVVRFQPSRHSEVEILGSFDDIESGAKLEAVFRRYPVVHGASHGRKRFTLFECTTCSRQIDAFEDPELANTRIDFIDAWVGPNVFASKFEVAFYEVSFGMGGLAAWHNVTAFSSEHDFKHKATCLRYQCPEDVLLYEDGKVVIPLSYSWHPATQQVAQTSGTIEHDPRVVIKSRDGRLPFYGDEGAFEWYITRIRTVIGLMIGSACPIYNCSGLFQKFAAPTETEGLKHEERFSRLWCRDINNDWVPSPFDIWILFVAVKDELRQVVSAFFRMAAVPAGYAGHLVFLYSSRTTAFTQGTLPELVYQFEGIHREVLGHKKWELTDRFKDILKEIRCVFPEFSDEEFDAIETYVRKRRNNYSHANPETYHKNFRLYIFATMWMRMFDTITVLYLCGLSPRTIWGGLGKNHEYREMVSSLPSLLRTGETC